MSNSAYLLGSVVRLTVTFKVGDVATDPSTITLVVGDAAGSPTTYTYGVSGISRTSAGVYWAEVVPDAAGTWVAVWTGAGDVDAVEEQTFDVVASSHPWATVAYPPVYASLPQLKAALRLNADDMVDDVELQRCLQVASRAIDDRCSDGPHWRRQFYVSPSETRIYRMDEERYWYARELRIEDAQTITGVTIDYNNDGVYETTLTADSDYQTRPRLAPFTRLVIPYFTGRYPFPFYGLGVSVTGTFGYSSTPPAAVQEACLLWAVRLWKRPQAPFGVLEGTLDTQPMRIGADADIAALLAPYVLPTMAFV